MKRIFLTLAALLTAGAAYSDGVVLVDALVGRPVGGIEEFIKVFGHIYPGTTNYACITHGVANSMLEQNDPLIKQPCSDPKCPKYRGVELITGGPHDTQVGRPYAIITGAATNSDSGFIAPIFVGRLAGIEAASATNRPSGEITNEVHTMLIEMSCSKTPHCPGTMVAVGPSQATYPPTYEHRCTVCKLPAYFYVSYPEIRHEPKKK